MQLLRNAAIENGCTAEQMLALWTMRSTLCKHHSFTTLQ